MTNWQLLKWMMQFLFPVKGLALLTAGLLILCDISEILTVNVTGHAINKIKDFQTAGDASQVMYGWLSLLPFVHFKAPVHVSPGFWDWVTSSRADAATIRSAIALLAGLVAGFAVLRFIREITNTRFSMTMVYYIRDAVYDKLQRVGFSFHDRISTGQLINRSLSDLQNVRSFVETSCMTSLDIVLMVGLNIANLMRMNWWVAGLAIIPLPIWVIYIMRFSKQIQPITKSTLESDDKNVSIITENIAGVHVVKAFATESAEMKKYSDNCLTFKERVLRRIRMHANFMPIIRSVATASHLSLFLVAGIMCLQRKMQVGDLMILGGTMGMILGRLQQVANINEQYQNAIVSARRLQEILMAPTNVPEKENALPMPKNRPVDVKFENVSFGYSPEKPVLHDISFSAPGGSVVAIVGPTGSGKTTLMNLLARFYDPQQGRIEIDGHDVRDYQLSAIHSQVSCVFQETYLFSLSVADNIAYGRPGIQVGDIEAAARLAQAHEFIEKLPKGYDTTLGERGQSLSGGQKQRLAIARALLTNPRILVLDDATAAVDPETEDLIRRGMQVIMEERTIFIIAHRISTVKRADLVIVLEKGRITQMGTHDQLVRQPGHYREIAMAQLADDDHESPEDSPSHIKRMRKEELIDAVVAHEKEQQQQHQQKTPVKEEIG